MSDQYTPPEGYRLLEEGEIIEEGDLNFIHSSQSWRRTGQAGSVKTTGWIYVRKIVEEVSHVANPERDIPQTNLDDSW